MTTATMTPAGLIAEAQAICEQVEAATWPASTQAQALIGYGLAYAIDQITACGLLAEGWIAWDDLGDDGEADPPMAAAERALDAAKAVQNRLAEYRRRAARHEKSVAA